ncbi:MAG: acyl-[acyl-carrier-protein]--UDP-N-acetylglucosamine O-acyltransferase [Verrucomicrobia bacterium]|nr:MAG: acyl-[acyl-carrier-protein]--UDP-N-acetylglucosamine O-acyltransferase [Verrucomicrobiota bacterium]
MIHATAIIHPKARLDSSVQVGPYAVIDEEVEIGPGCIIGPYVYLTGLTSIGAGNRFFAGAVIGEEPQDLKFKGGSTRLRIGDNNIFREHVTVHRSNNSEQATVIGSNCFLMHNSHVAHDVVLGTDVIVASGALLAGHVEVADRALVSGNCLVHQFVHIGTLALMRGGSAISKDLPPYTIARGENGICGLNLVGLRRAGMPSGDQVELSRLYRALFRSGLNMSNALAEAREKFSSEPAKVMMDFVASSKRGVCFDVSVRGKKKPQPRTDTDAHG